MEWSKLKSAFLVIGVLISPFVFRGQCGKVENENDYIVFPRAFLSSNADQLKTFLTRNAVIEHHSSEEGKTSSKESPMSPSSDETTKSGGQVSTGASSPGLSTNPVTENRASKEEMTSPPEQPLSTSSDGSINHGDHDTTSAASIRGLSTEFTTEHHTSEEGMTSSQEPPTSLSSDEITKRGGQDTTRASSPGLSTKPVTENRASKEEMTSPPEQPLSTSSDGSINHGDHDTTSAASIRGLSTEFTTEHHTSEEGMKSSQEPPTSLSSDEITKRGGQDTTRASSPGLSTKPVTEVNPCASDPCQSGSTCQKTAFRYHCQCQPGYGGINCENEINECNSNPCQNSGTCIDMINGYACYGWSGFTGQVGETNINSCFPNPCLNGVCTDLVDGFSCNCNPGFSGTTCEINIDECVSNPCMNGGTCDDHNNGFVCFCKINAGDTLCDKVLDCSNVQYTIPECGAVEVTSPNWPNSYEPSKTCQWFLESPGDSPLSIILNSFDTEPLHDVLTIGNGHSSADTSTVITELDGVVMSGTQYTSDENRIWIAFTTASQDSRQGFQLTVTDICDPEVNPCASDPCQSGSTCQKTAFRYHCQCQPGYGGINCENDLPCDSNPCQNRGTCENIGDGDAFRCNCPVMFSGDLCETEITATCHPNYCLNGGTCREIDGTLSCTCPSTFIGEKCATDVPQWHHWNHSLYTFVSTTEMTWEDAANACSSMREGAHLVFIESELENKEVSRLAKVASEGQTLRWWIGLTDKDTEGDWKWYNVSLNYDGKWDGSQPDNAGENEDCGELGFRWSGDNAFWNDIPCTNPNKFICESGFGNNL